LNVFVYENFRRHLGKLEIKRLDDQNIDTCGIQKFSLLVQGRQKARGTVGLDNLSGMGFKRQENRLPPERPSPIDDDFENRPMSEMNTVKVPDGKDRAVEWPRKPSRPKNELQVPIPPGLWPRQRLSFNSGSAASAHESKSQEQRF
jgi:hypothetical protein